MLRRDLCYVKIFIPTATKMTYPPKTLLYCRAVILEREKKKRKKWKTNKRNVLRDIYI